MRNGSVRAGSLLVGIAGLLALPAAAVGQLGPVTDTVDRVGQTVQQAVPQAIPEIKAPAPVQHSAPAAPATPAAPSVQAPAPAPAPSASSGQGAAGSSASSSAAPAKATSGRKASGRKAGHKSASKKAHAASAADKPVRIAAVPLGQEETTTAAAPGDAGSFTAGEASATGTAGDSRLPFTGSYALWLAAIGLGVLLTGVMLRMATRTRVARRH